MSRRLLFVVDPGREWMGGVYYVRNILKTLSYAGWMQSKDVHLLCPLEHQSIFKPLASDYPRFEIHTRVAKKNLRSRILNKLAGPVVGRFDTEIRQVCSRLGIDAIFPVATFRFASLRATQIHWIPDFQHVKLPDFFTVSDRRHRDREFLHMSRSTRPLVLSSRTSLEHLKEFDPRHKCQPVVLPFIADIDDEIRQMSPDRDSRNLAKLGLPLPGDTPGYLYVPNQFWRHKDHMSVVLAMAELRRQGADVPLVVCTGSTKDYRSAGYYESLTRIVGENGLQERFRVLSMVERHEQLSVLRNCHALLQPSLFEGWGTGVQEAKRLGCRLLLSDIPIHREQCDSESIFFEPGNASDLANAMRTALASPRPLRDEARLIAINAESARCYADGAQSIFEGSYV